MSHCVGHGEGWLIMRSTLRQLAHPPLGSVFVYIGRFSHRCRGSQGNGVLVTI